MIKVLIGYKKSAAMKEDSSLDFPDQLHYFYTNSKNLLIDLYLDSSQLSDDEMDEIAKDIHYYWFNSFSYGGVYCAYFIPMLAAVVAQIYDLWEEKHI